MYLYKTKYFWGQYLPSNLHLEPVSMIFASRVHALLDVFGFRRPSKRVHTLKRREERKGAQPNPSTRQAASAQRSLPPGAYPLPGTAGINRRGAQGHR